MPVTPSEIEYNYLSLSDRDFDSWLETLSDRDARDVSEYLLRMMFPETDA